MTGDRAKRIEDETKAIGGVIGAIGTLLSILVLLSGLPICQRAFTFSLIISVTFAAYLHLKLSSIEIPSGPPRGSVIKHLLKIAPVKVVSEIVSVLLMILFALLILFPELLPISGCETPIPPPAPTALPTQAFSLSDARVEFIITFSDGSAMKIPDGEILTLTLDDKIVIKANVTTAEHLSFPHDLLFQYKSASGENSLSDTLAFVAEQTGEDIITVQIMDQITGDEISRSMRVVIR